ncbi:MAG: LCP family protein [Oscillospiraceae bacterium]
MKLFGSNKRSKHLSGSSGRETAGKENTRVNTNKKSPGKGKKKKNKLLRVIIIVLAVIIALVIAALAYWFTAVKPPDVVQNKRQPHDGSGNLINSDNPEEPVVDNRTGEKYTFLAVGMDDGNGNTDTIMVATFDTSDYTLNVVSIPRDTLVNVSWSVKKANTLYAYGGVDGLKAGIADIIGYDVDFYAIIDLNAFIELVDAIGGIYFDVPQNMNYSDPAQDLYINISKGPQTLSGEDAMKVWRFRATYAQGDIKRIEVQHDLLMAAAKQILDNVDSVPITTLADIFINDVKTDLTYGNIIWFAKELLKMDLENINIMTIPENYADEVNGISYPTIYVDEWLEMLNTYLNPFDDPIVETDLSILTRNSSGKLYSTDGVYNAKSSWGNGGSSSSSGGSSSGGSSSGGTSSGSNSNGNSGGTTTDPGTTDPGATDPGVTDPGTTDPGTTDPGTTDPGTTDPGTTAPGTGEETTDPGTTDPGGTGPDPDPGAGSGEGNNGNEDPGYIIVDDGAGNNADQPADPVNGENQG